MHIQEFGENNEKTVVMLHGLAMSWQMFLPAIRLLEPDFRVLAVAIPGHNLEDHSKFTSIEEIAVLIEDELLQRGLLSVFCLYGLSMGGALALRILADARVQFRYAILDGGITPYELPRMLTRVILCRDVSTTLLGRRFPCLLKLPFPPERYSAQFLGSMRQVLQHLSVKSIWRAYDSTDNFSMPPQFPVLKTKIVYWYGEKEKNARKPDIQYISHHVPGVQIEEIPGMGHTELICSQPEKFIRKFKENTK